MRALVFALFLAACASPQGSADSTSNSGVANEGNGVWLIGCTGDHAACTRRADALCDGDFQLIESGPLESATGARIGHGIRVRCT